MLRGRFLAIGYGRWHAVPHPTGEDRAQREPKFQKAGLMRTTTAVNLDKSSCLEAMKNSVVA